MAENETASTDPRTHPAPGIPLIQGTNRLGLWTLFRKEVTRFFKVQLQTVWAPAVTTLLFLAIFTVALGRGGREVLGVPFNDFLAPGLIVMAMIQNAFANTSSSVLVAKIQGVIVDVLMPPLSAGELVFAYVAGAVARGVIVGAAVWLAMLLWPGVDVGITNGFALVYYGVSGCVLLGLLGLLTGMWAEKFDHSAAITNFVVQPLSLLSGTFYTIDRLPGFWADISHANPFFYIIDGFRYGFLGVSDGPLMVGAMVLLVLNIALWAATYMLWRRGWRLKA